MFSVDSSPMTDPMTVLWFTDLDCLDFDVSCESLKA